MAKVWLPASTDIARALRGDLVQRGKLPRGKLRINWSNQLAKKLKAFVVVHNGQFIDLVSGRTAIEVTSGGKFVSLNGIESFDTQDSGSYKLTNIGNNTALYDRTLFCSFTLRSDAEYVEKGIVSLENNFRIGHKFLSYAMLDTGWTSTKLIDANFVAGEVYNYTVNSKSNSQADGFINESINLNVGGTFRTYSLSGNGDLTLGYDYLGIFSGNLIAAAYFEPVLTTEEAVALSTNPYQLVEAANEAPVLVGVPAGGGVTGTGDLVGAGSEVVGTGTRTVTGAGALEGQGAAVVGTGERTITGTGALIGQGSDVSGTGATGGVHTGTGDLIGAGSEVAGVGKRTITGTGALLAQGSAVVGVGERTIIGSGDLVGAGAEVSGSGAVGGITTGTGDLVGAGSEIVGTGLRTVTGSGALVAQGSVVTGTGERTVTGAGALIGSGSEIVGAGVGGDVTTGAGALVGQGSAVTGTGTRTITGIGDLVAAGSIIVGAGVRTITGSGALVGAGSEVVGRQAAHDFATGNTNIWMLGPRGRVWSLENRDPYDAHKRGREVCSS